ncbi:MAG TPA: PIN domain-containing protein [Caulobacteraceae bacterium]|nr:PIN domain-containing protein [Caulobacteraceae bacterium]
MRAVPIRPHVAAAFAIANDLDRSAYDALYLAVAIAERAVLVTADMRFAAAASSHPIYARSIRLLA